MRSSTDEDMATDVGSTRVAGAIVIGAILALIVIRITFERK